MEAMTAPEPPLKPILLVEDNDDVREAMTHILELNQYRVVPVPGGREALVHLHEGLEPCLILLDLRMPGIDGWQFRKEQTQDPRLASIPVIVYSGDGRVKENATSMGAAGYLPKPVNVPMMLDLVANHCLRD
jgi:CheY-like chemotaxis protein